jgi:hypothetical protein
MRHTTKTTTDVKGTGAGSRTTQSGSRKTTVTKKTTPKTTTRTTGETQTH